MKIYCICCKEYILDTSDDMVLGGAVLKDGGAHEYHGGMFKAASSDKWHSQMFDCRAHTRGGDLWCPRCTGKFLGSHNELLTEHGIIHPGQKTVDTSFNIVWQKGEEGGAPGQLKYVKDSRPVPTAPKAAPKGFPEDEKTPIPKAVKPKAEKKQSNGFKCKKCSKEYMKTHKRHYDKHVMDCEG